jgi:SNF2 family DNA or RNA helicase
MGMIKINRDDQVQSKKFGAGSVMIDNGDTVVVRFAHGIEEVEKTDLRQILTPLQALNNSQWHIPIEVIARTQAEAIQSVNDAWGVFALSRINLLPHQLWVCRKVVERLPSRWLVADDVGLGKTIEGGLILSSLISRGAARRILVICPASLVGQWQERLREMFDIRMLDYHPELDTPKKDFWNTNNQVVVSLQTLRMDRDGRHQRLLASDAWDMVIVDEAHHLNADEKTGATLGYSLIEKLIKNQRISSMVFFTGTPHRGKNFGFLSILHLLNEKFNPQRSLEEQLPLLSSVMIRNNKQNVTDLKGEKLFRAPQVKSETYRYSSSEAAFYDKLTDFILTGKAYASSLESQEGRAVMLVLIAMQKLASSSVAAIRRALRGRLARIVAGHKRLQDLKRHLIEYEELETQGDNDALSRLEEQIVELSAELRLMENEEPRLRELLEAAEQVQDENKIAKIISVLKNEYSGRSILFFTEYKATQSQLMSVLMRYFGDRCVTFINGDNCADEVVNSAGKQISIRESRETAMDKFLSGEAQFLVSTEAGGEGIDLQEKCHTLIHVDLPWNPMRLHQRVGRLNRYGQTQQVEVLTMRNPDTVESRIWDTLTAKIEKIKLALNQVMDEPEDLMQLVLGMTSPKLINEIFAGANGVPQGRLSDWFDLKTAQFGGQDAIQTVRELVGNAARFDFQQVSAQLPRVDLPDLKPFFTTMLQFNGRRVVDENGMISFKTPENWLGDIGVRQSYDEMVFNRSLKGKQASQKILGIGQKVMQQAMKQAKSFSACITALPYSLLEKPICVFRTFDRVTGGDNTVRSAVIGVEMDPSDAHHHLVLQDWEVLQKMNRIIESKKLKRTDLSIELSNNLVVQQTVEQAEQVARDNLRNLDLPFIKPEVELLSVLWAV